MTADGIDATVDGGTDPDRITTKDGDDTFPLTGPDACELVN